MTMFLLCGVALYGLSGASASILNSTNSSAENTTNITSQLTINATNSSINQTSVNQSSNLITSTTKNSIVNQTQSENTTQAAAGDVYSNIHALWINTNDYKNINVTELEEANITDVFVKSNIYSTPTYQTVLSSVLAQLNGTGIGVHAWITCFKDASGNWIDPQSSTGQSHEAEVIAAIENIVKNYDVAGIHLDYVRYPGTAYKNNASLNETANIQASTNAVTSFVERVYSAVKAIKQDVAVSAAVMPEGSVNAKYYGQDYSALAQYLDFMVAMVYKGNYNATSAWVGTTTAYIVAHANGTPVVTGLQTYKNDTDTTPLSASELINDTQVAIGNGSSGYALFRYGLIDENFYNEVAKLTVTAVDPVNNAVSIAVDKVITVTFSKPIQAGNKWIELVNSKGALIPITWSINGNILTITPSSVLSHGVKYTLLIHTGSVTDLAGNNIAGYVSRFTTSTDSTAPTVKTVDPANNAVNVAADKVINVTFSEAIKAGTGWIELVTSNGTIVPSTWSTNGKVLTVTPSSVLSHGVKYLLLIHTGSVTDLAGNKIAGYVSRFTVETVAPTVKAVDPANNAVNVAVSKVIKVTFSESIKAGTGWIELQNSNGTIVPTTWSINGNILTVTPSSALSEDTKYLLLIHTGSVTDLAGNNVAGYVSRFTTDSSTVTFTRAQILDASARVKAYVEANYGLPNYVTISTTQVSMAQFLQMMSVCLLQIKNGTTSNIALPNVSAPANPTDTVKSGNINKTEYLDMAQRIVNFSLNGTAPNYVSSSLGNIQFESAVYIYSKILNFYYTNSSTLPNYVTVSPWTTITNKTSTSTIPAELKEYLQATANCQSTNAQIIALSKSIIANAGATTTYAKAVAIFNWVRDNIGYSFYYNTNYGAVGTLNAKTGNCVDTSHLLIALERAAGIPARYEHGYCKFSTAWYGHVWAQVYVDGKWYSADAISSRNTFGVINNWNTATATIYGTYAELPF
ncbi:Ig-like domain-containing protein [Methanobacterium paludis]|uniref:Transglutaminase domain-containing protein n=1 Tax=Methanobacterium paludis (strain DSM 25820 / JCM 18151 / SWAN1) TaxID=868131 RepID=F6D696_METPW|nr:Ig-like domain-containing protein [Methanobacterium paludis]AEG18309.1 transglutaminase domain-containing protein [Methanobacterium paludis]